MEPEKLIEAINGLKDVSAKNQETLEKVLKAYQEKVDSGKVETPQTIEAPEIPVKPEPARKIVFGDQKADRFQHIEKILDKPPAKLSEIEKEIHDFNDDVYLLSKMLKRDPRTLKTWHRLDENDELKKAMDTATSGEGAEWVPTGFSASLIELLRLERKVSGLHSRFTMPTDPYIFPVDGAQASAYKVTEQTADTSQTKIPVSTPGTAQKSLTSVGNAARVLTSHYLEEDSIIPVIPYIKESIAKALVDAEETATVNGDTAGTHMDSDVTAGDDVRKNWDGYRKMAQAAASVDLGTFNTAGLRSIRKAMKKFGVVPSKLAWIAGISVYNQLLGLTEVITVDKYGPAATILSGELGKFDGIPIVISEYIREDLNASGVYDGVTTTKTIIELVFRPGILYADRRAITMRVLTELYAESEQDAVIATRRYLLWTPYTVATDLIVGEGYNITS